MNQLNFEEKRNLGAKIVEIEEKLEGISNGCSLAQQNLTDIKELKTDIGLHESYYANFFNDLKEMKEQMNKLQGKILSNFAIMCQFQEVLRELFKQFKKLNWDNDSFIEIEKLEKLLGGEKTVVRTLGGETKQGQSTMTDSKPPSNWTPEKWIEYQKRIKEGYPEYNTIYNPPKQDCEHRATYDDGRCVRCGEPSEKRLKE